MASKSSNAVTTVYQCSECDHCSQTLEDATLHAVQEHGEDDREDEDMREDSEEESYSQIKIKEDKDAISSDEEYSSIYKQMNGIFGLQRDEDGSDPTWSVGATKALIDCVHDHYTDLRSKTTKKRPIWELIKASLVHNQIPDVTSSRCEQRWRSLVAEQKRYMSNASKPYGKSKLKKPNFYDELAEVIGDDPSDFYPRVDANAAATATTFRSKVKRDPLSYSPQCLGEGSSGGSSSSDALAALNRLVALLEQREIANRKFHDEVLELEREKLKHVQRFVESREKFNAKRLQLMKDWMMNQPRAKRKRGGD